MRSANRRPALRKPTPLKYSTPSIDIARGGSHSALSSEAGKWPWKARLWMVRTTAGRGPPS